MYRFFLVFVFSIMSLASDICEAAVACIPGRCLVSVFDAAGDSEPRSIAVSDFEKNYLQTLPQTAFKKFIEAVLIELLPLDPSNESPEVQLYNNMQLNFIRIPLYANAASKSHKEDSNTYSGFEEKKSDCGGIGIPLNFYWIERDVIFELTAIPVNKNILNDIPKDLSEEKFVEYVQIYESRILKSRSEVDAELGKRTTQAEMPAGIFWLLGHAPQNTRGPFIGSVIEYKNRLLEERAAEQGYLQSKDAKANLCR